MVVPTYFSIFLQFYDCKVFPHITAKKSYSQRHELSWKWFSSSWPMIWALKTVSVLVEVQNLPTALKVLCNLARANLSRPIPLICPLTHQIPAAAGNSPLSDFCYAFLCSELNATSLSTLTSPRSGQLLFLLLFHPKFYFLHLECLPWCPLGPLSSRLGWDLLQLFPTVLCTPLKSLIILVSDNVYFFNLMEVSSTRSGIGLFLSRYRQDTMSTTG